jgi:isopenicillin N synthase-like dioxygenase
MSGASALRLRVVTATARTAPPRTIGSSAGVASIIIGRTLGVDAPPRCRAAARRCAERPHRISLVFFQNPNPDTVIRCLPSCVGAGEKYPPITVGEHYLGKLMKAGHSRLDANADDALTNS